MNKDQIDQIACLHRYNLILASITTKDELETACRLVYSKLQCRDLTQFNGLVLEAMCSFVLSKILVLGMGAEAIKLVEIMLEREIMPSIYYDEFQKLLSEQLDSLYGIRRDHNTEAVRYDRTLEKQFRANLSILLKTDNNHDSMIAKTMGYSFLTPAGNIIWGDANTYRILEQKSAKNSDINLFNLMIPFSVNFLHKKFGKELFKSNVRIGSQICFSFVIYSKQALNKYFKQLKKKKVSRVCDIREDEGDKGLYFKFLKAVSCRATLVALKCSKDDLKNIQGTDVNSDNGNETPNKKITDVGQGTNATIKGVSDDSDELSINLAVMVEMRISKNIPDFNYKEMEDDPKIWGFKDYIKKRLKDNE